MAKGTSASAHFYCGPATRVQTHSAFPSVQRQGWQEVLLALPIVFGEICGVCMHSEGFQQAALPAPILTFS